MDTAPMLDNDLPTSAEPPLVYVILGAAGSGRRQVLCDLVEGGIADTDHAVALLSYDEAADEYDSKLPHVARWTWHEGVISAVVPPGTTHLFFLTDGRRNPVDQLEALQKWLKVVQAELGRVITIVNCALAEKTPALMAWYEACVHFSDVVLLNKREGVANKWMSDFQLRFKELCYPCLFEMVKGGRVKNPLVILDPQARRMSHIFDIDEWTGIDLEGVEFGTEDEDDTDDEESPAPKKSGSKKSNSNESPPDDDDWKPEVEPYFEMLPNGRRAKEIPDISKYLE